MVDAVLDASAALAVLNSESGADEVWTYLPGALISSVNVAEVATKLIDGGAGKDKADEFVERLGLQVVAFDRNDARLVGHMRYDTKAAGLSLGDRACLVLAQRRELPAVTADRRWRDVNVGLDIRLIR